MIKDKIKTYFLQNPTARLRVRQIERATKTHLPSVIRYTKELEEEHILKSKEISGVRFYQADRTSYNYIFEKRIHNIKAIKEAGLIEHLEKQGPKAIVLFGSYEKGEDIEDSDIDIFVQSKNKIEGLDEYEKKLNRGIQLFIKDDLRKIQNKDLANNIINGTKLKGFLQVL